MMFEKERSLAVIHDIEKTFPLQFVFKRVGQWSQLGHHSHGGGKERLHMYTNAKGFQNKTIPKLNETISVCACGHQRQVLCIATRIAPPPPLISLGWGGGVGG